MKRKKEYNYAMYTGFELFLFQMNLIFHLLMKNWKLFQTSQNKKILKISFSSKSFIIFKL